MDQDKTTMGKRRICKASKGLRNSTWAPSSRGGANVPRLCDGPHNANVARDVKPTEVGECPNKIEKQMEIKKIVYSYMVQGK
jgi:hypothetical protein